MLVNKREGAEQDLVVSHRVAHLVVVIVIVVIGRRVASDVHVHDCCYAFY